MSTSVQAYFVNSIGLGDEKAYMDIIFVYDYPSTLKFVLLIEQLYQICPVDVFANVAGDCLFPGPILS